MCGICGYAGRERDERLLERMTEVIRHRGPDDEGFFLNDAVGLGVRRLSIIDVAGGRQPIFNEDDSIAIIFNGEIYNYRTLADDMVRRGHRFRTRSDTETIVHLYEEFDTDCVQHLRGMFAFALYDSRRRRLFVARDRLGIKPLYYWERGGRLLFASEIKALLESDDIPREPHLPAIDAYLSLRYVPGPETMLAGIRKLPAGHRLIWQDGQVRIERYWTPQPSGGPYQRDEYYRERFAELFTESVRLRLMSEVPLGAFLSGGIDSSAIVAAMSRMLDQPVKTFSVGFDWAGDELPAARAVAQRLGCKHYEVLCRPEDLGLLPEIVWHLDEPVGDAIVVPMYLLARSAREHVTVVLSGEGADETLAGYLPHKIMCWTQRYAQWTPKSVRNAVVRPLVARVPVGLLNVAFRYPARLGARGRWRLLDYLELAGGNDLEAEYLSLISLFDARDKAELYSGALGGLEGSLRSFLHPNLQGAGYLDRVLALQYAHWLPDDILMKQDKMTMAHSLEGRVPFLDHILVEFLLQTPPHLKLRGLTDKWLLRDHLAAMLPGKTSRRPKRAFYIPLERYFGSGPLTDLVETCLSEKSVRKRGYFNWDRVRALRASTGEPDFLFGKQVLALVILELWHRIFIDREPGWRG